MIGKGVSYHSMIARLVDATETQGFERAIDNTLVVGDNECPKCLKPFGQRGRKSNAINIITAKGRDTWCEDCVIAGIENGICRKGKK